MRRFWIDVQLIYTPIPRKICAKFMAYGQEWLSGAEGLET